MNLYTTICKKVPLQFPCVIYDSFKHLHRDRLNFIKYFQQYFMVPVRVYVSSMPYKTLPLTDSDNIHGCSCNCSWNTTNITA